MTQYISIQKCLCLIFLLLNTMACQSGADRKRTTNHSSAPQVSFSDTVRARYAKGFQITYKKNYKLLKVLDPFQNRLDTLRYSLVPRKLADEIDIKNTQEIAIPIRSLIATSTTHVALAQILKAGSILKGIAAAKYVYSSRIQKRIDQGSITSFQQGELNKETVMYLQPDLVMISGGQSSQFDSYQILINSGINVMVNAEWLEKTPLGKAEWIKVMGALLNKERLANKIFAAVAKRYSALKAKADTVKNKPVIINNMPYKGSWFMPGGKSYSARYIQDAGGNYVWSDSDKTGALQKDFEAVYSLGLRADIWINPGAAKTRKDVLAKDGRFRDFKPFKTGQIYNNNRRKRPGGGNDYWESGVVHPDIILADLIKIFHPKILPEHQLYYYQRLK